jgi:hypothetical protein
MRLWKQDGIRESLAHTARFEVLVSAPNTVYCFLVVLAFPRQIFSERNIEGGGGVLAATLGVFLKLGLSFGGDGNHFHASRVGTS